MLLRPHQDGLVMKVKVVPGASRTQIAGLYGDGIKVTVSAPPEKGAANATVLALLASRLGIHPSNVQLVSGHTNARKEVLIRGLSTEQIEQSLL